MHPIYIIRLQIRLKSSDWTRTVLSFSTHPAKTETMRMKRACELMKETTLSVADIAEQTGFQTPGYFIKGVQEPLRRNTGALCIPSTPTVNGVSHVQNGTIRIAKAK